MASPHEVQGPQATSQYARSLLEARPRPPGDHLREGKITDVNAATEQVTGHAREELIGTDFSDYFTEPEAGARRLPGGLQGRPASRLPAGHPSHSGAITDVLYNASLYRDEAGQVIGVFAAARDISELKREPRRTLCRAAPTSWLAPTRSWSSSPTWPRTTCRSRCAWWRATSQLLARRYKGKLDAEGRGVHRLRGRRRQAHAAADQRPADLLARRARAAEPLRADRLRRRARRGSGQPAGGHRREQRRSSPATSLPRCMADSTQLGAALPEPHRQRHQVPRRRRRRVSTSRRRAARATGSSRCATTASASSRSTPSASS